MMTLFVDLGNAILVVLYFLVHLPLMLMFWFLVLAICTAIFGPVFGLLAAVIIAAKYAKEG